MSAPPSHLTTPAPQILRLAVLTLILYMLPHPVSVVLCAVLIHRHQQEGVDWMIQHLHTWLIESKILVAPRSAVEEGTPSVFQRIWKWISPAASPSSTVYPV